jgi:hypothetical protein
MWSLFTPIIFAIIASILTSWIRSVTLGIDDGTKSNTEVTQPTPGNDVEATAIPDATESTNSGTEDQPPPYQPPEQETPTPAQVPNPTQPKVKRSSAHAFVMGTAMFLSIIASLFLGASALQSIIFCEHWSPVSLFPRIFYWAVFSIPCLWATVGASCWLMLLRDLWGPEMRKRLPIKETALIYGLVCVLVAPFAFVVVVIGGGLVKAVETCQRWFCGDALEEADESEESVELQEGPTEDRLESTGGSGSREEERVGLIGGVEK